MFFLIRPQPSTHLKKGIKFLSDFSTTVQDWAILAKQLTLLGPGEQLMIHLFISFVPEY